MNRIASISYIGASASSSLSFSTACWDSVSCNMWLARAKKARHTCQADRQTDLWGRSGRASCTGFLRPAIRFSFLHQPLTETETKPGSIELFSNQTGLILPPGSSMCFDPNFPDTWCRLSIPLLYYYDKFPKPHLFFLFFSLIILE